MSATQAAAPIEAADRTGADAPQSKPVQLDLRAIRRQDPRFRRRNDADAGGPGAQQHSPVELESGELPSSAPSEPPVDLSAPSMAPWREAPAATPEAVEEEPAEEKAPEAAVEESPPLMERLGSALGRLTPAFTRIAAPIFNSFSRSSQEATQQMGADISGSSGDSSAVLSPGRPRQRRLRSSSTVARELQAEEDAAYAMELQRMGSPNLDRVRPAARTRSSSTIARELQAEEDHSTAELLQREFDRENAAPAIAEEGPGDLQEEPQASASARRASGLSLSSNSRTSPHISPALPASFAPTALRPLRLDDRRRHSDGEEQKDNDPIRGATNRSQSRPGSRRELDQARTSSARDLEDLRNRITQIRTRTDELRRENSSTHRRSSSEVTPRSHATYLRHPRHTAIIDSDRERVRGSSITPRSYGLSAPNRASEPQVLSPGPAAGIPDSPPRNPPPRSTSAIGSRDLRRRIARREIRQDPSAMADHRSIFANSQSDRQERDRRYLNELGLDRRSSNYSPPRSQSAAGVRRLFRNSSSRSVLDLEPRSPRSSSLRRNHSARNVRENEDSTNSIVQNAMDLVSSSRERNRRGGTSERDNTARRIESMEERASSLQRDLSDFRNMSVDSVSSRNRSRDRRESRSRMSRERHERERREMRERERRRERRPGLGARSERRTERRDEPIERWFHNNELDAPFYSGRGGARRDSLNARRGRRGMVRLSRESRELFDEIDNMDHDQLVRLGEQMGPVVNPGATPQLIEAMPAAKWTPPSATATNPVTQCSICLSDFEEGDWTRCLPCMHNTFHKDCIDEWLLRKAECPICRKNIHDHPDIQRTRRHVDSRSSRRGNAI